MELNLEQLLDRPQHLPAPGCKEELKESPQRPEKRISFYHKNGVFLSKIKLEKSLKRGKERRKRSKRRKKIKRRSGVNFTNVLRAAFAPTVLLQ
jgi:hypothetical protein